MKKILFCVTVFISNQIFAAEMATPKEAGDHIYSVLVYKKSINPENIMIVETKLNDKCEVEEPNLDFYWLMGGTKYKPVHPMIKRGIRERIQLVESANHNAHEFSIKLNALTEMKTDLKDVNLLVKTSGQGAKCHADGQMTLGPSDKNIAIHVDSIYAVAEKTLLSARPISVTLNGTNLKTGAEVHRTYEAK